MKKTLFSLFMTSALAASLAFSQTTGTGASSGTGTGPSIANMVQHRIGYLTTFLSLSADQQAQATTIFTDAATADSTARASMQAAHTALKAAIKANDVNAISQAATTIGNLTATSIATDAKASAAFYQILTADQQTKFDQINAQGHRGFGPGGFGGPGPAGFGGRR